MLIALIVTLIALIATASALAYCVWLIYQKRRPFLRIEKNDQVKGFDGKIYRVIDIRKSDDGKHDFSYDVVDDNADMRIRETVYPSEVVLHKKFKNWPFPHRCYEQIRLCPGQRCRNDVVMRKGVDDVYHGKCDRCGHIMHTDNRPKFDPETLEARKALEAQSCK